MKNASRWLLACPASHINLIFRLLLADAVFQRLGNLSWPYSATLIRRPVFDVSLSACYISNYAWSPNLPRVNRKSIAHPKSSLSLCSIATIPTLKSLQCHVEYLSNREWTTNDLRDAAFTIDLFCTLDLRLVRRTESPRSLFQPHTHSNILTLLCRLVEEQHPVANYILFDSNAVIAWLVSIWNQLEVSTLHQKAAVSLVGSSTLYSSTG